MNGRRPFRFWARHYAEYLRKENRARQGRGETPQGLDETLTEALSVSAGDLIQRTHWPNIDLIGAQLDLYWAEFQIPVWRMQGRGWKLWDALGDRLEADGVLNDYDIVILDTPPALGYLTINALAAADILLVPLGASFLEFDSTGRFFDMLHATFSSIEETENMAARALGLSETRFEWDAVRAVLTRYDGTQQAEMAALMQAYMGGSLSPWRQDFTALIGQAGEQIAGIYEADYRDFNRETYARGRAAFDETYAGFKRLLIGAWHRDMAARAAAVMRRRNRAGERDMAKRKRLSPALLAADIATLETGSNRPLETHSRPPIAQVAGETAEHAAFAEVARTLTEAREEGRLIQRLPLAEIETGTWCATAWSSTGEMAALVASLRARGQQVPIEVVARERAAMA
jgi:chromosome partitioning protein